MHVPVSAAIESALATHFPLLARRLMAGIEREGPGLLMAVVDEGPQGLTLDPDRVRYVTRRTWTEYVVSAFDAGARGAMAEAIEEVACALDGALLPLQLPVMVIHETEADINLSLLMVRRPSAAEVPALRPTN